MDELQKIIHNPLTVLTVDNKVIRDLIDLIETSTVDLAYLLPLLYLRLEPHSERYITVYRELRESSSSLFPGKLEAVGLFLYSLNPLPFYKNSAQNQSFSVNNPQGTPQLISPAASHSTHHEKVSGNSKVVAFKKGIKSPAPMHRIATPIPPSTRDDGAKKSVAKKVAFAADIPEPTVAITATPALRYNGSPMPRFSASPINYEDKPANFYETPIVQSAEIGHKELSDTITLSPTSALSSHGDLFDGFDEESFMTLDELNEPTRTFNGLAQVPADLIMNKYGFKDDNDDDFMPPK